MSAISTVGGDQDGAYKDEGTINTGYIPNRRYLLNADRKKFISEIKKQGVKLGDGKGSKTGNEIDKIKELNKKNPKFKRKIKVPKKKVTNDNGEGDDNGKHEDASD